MSFEMKKIKGFDNTAAAGFLKACAMTRKAGEQIFAVSAPAPAAPAPAM